jgi:serine/threonine protein kinase
MGNHVHGTPSEWFSVGVTLHELLTGRRPFEATRLQAFRHSPQYPANYVYSATLSGQTPNFPSPENEINAAAPAIRQRKFDALLPESLYGLGQCDHLSLCCKDFVRMLLVPDVRHQQMYFVRKTF